MAVDLVAGLNPCQKTCVECVDGPLLVSAGAGSGKTFMLTRRIAYALLHPEKSGVHDISEDVLAITFTELAAAEIKARVRSTLRSAGLIDQALKVDSAWISTIHGMCSRILHDHALELGFDPAFGILDDTDKNNLMLEAINEAIASSGYATAHLFELFSASYVREMLEQLLNAMSSVQDGANAINLGAPTRPANLLAGDVYDALTDLVGTLEMVLDQIGKKKPPAVAEKIQALAADPICGLAALERAQANKLLTYEELAVILGTINASFGSTTAALKAPVLEFKIIYYSTVTACKLGIAGQSKQELLQLALKTREFYTQKKRAIHKLDQDDLLQQALLALKNHESLARQYRDKFKLVMVDEFQDTSALQIAIISLLDGARDERLCTVGDTQQSIYRFRGADVDTYREHKRHMRGEAGATYQELGTNYRSHGDVIHFVNRVFAQERVFGRGSASEFIELDAAREHDNPCMPRIDMALITNAFNKAHTEERYRSEALYICDRFCKLHEGIISENGDTVHYNWGDMVILLGTTTFASLFANTLRERGIPCIVTGGSTFIKMPEAQTICTLAQAIANPLDDYAIKELLVSDMFGLDADELLSITALKRGGSSGLWHGIQELCKNADASSLPARIQLASDVLNNAVRRSRTMSPSRVLEYAVAESGWLNRLQQEGPQGTAQAANILKAIRVARSQEDNKPAQRGMSAVAERLAAKFSEDKGIKEKPGALNVSGQDAVRIMTIHASKGLEFPVVALAAFHNTLRDNNSLKLETIGGTIHMTLTPPSSVLDLYGTLSKTTNSTLSKALADYAKATGSEHLQTEEAPGNNPAETYDALSFYQAIIAHAQAGELAELRRKFYVGATRPREVLILAAEGASASQDKRELGQYYNSEIIEDIRHALVGPDRDFPNIPMQVDFGGDIPMTLTKIQIEVDELGVISTVDRPLQDYLVSDTMRNELLTSNASLETPQEQVNVSEPLDINTLLPLVLPCNPLRAGTFSYTMLSKHGDTSGAAETDPDEVAPESESPLNIDTESDAEPLEAAPHRYIDATSFGSAFHASAQWMAEKILATRTGANSFNEFDVSDYLPSNERLAQIARTWNLPVYGMPRLKAALSLWAHSSAAQAAYAYECLEPEASLYVTLLGHQGEPLRLEGSIDLLCHAAGSAQNSKALVIDYKTGGSPAETPEQLHEKHLLQAQCYAYAVLLQGYQSVDLCFVRVEVPDPSNPQEPQTVRYTYTHQDLPHLEQTLRDAQ